MFKIFRTPKQKADKLIIEGVYLDEYACVNGDNDKEVNLFILKKMKEKSFEFLFCGSIGNSNGTYERFYFKKEKEK